MPDEITSKLRPQLLGRMTQRAVVDALRDRGPMSRADIARITGISPTTVSSAIVQVLKAGFVEETDAAINGPGRPGKLLRLAREGVRALGVSIEPEWCELIAGGLDGAAIRKPVRFPTPNTYARLLAEIERHAQKWLEPGSGRTLGLGLSLPGLIDPTGDRTAFSPNFHQTDEQRPGHDLAERLGMPTVILQESDALCLAERRAQNSSDLAVLDYAGGLGISAIAGGRLMKRHINLPSELGHVTVQPGGLRCGCGNRGCLETLATDFALARAVSEKLHNPVTVDEAFEAIREGRVDARAEIETAIEYLAVAVAAVANLYAPPLIALHGRLLDLDPQLLIRLEEKARPRMLAPLRNRAALAKSKSTKAHGALAGILDHLFDELGPVLSAA